MVDWAVALRQIDFMKRKTRRQVPKMDPKVLMEYDRWVVRHLDEVSRKYPHKVIGVYRNKLIAVGNSFLCSCRRTGDQGIPVCDGSSDRRRS